MIAKKMYNKSNSLINCKTLTNFLRNGGVFVLLIDKVPSYIYRSLENEGVDCGKLMLAAYCDMNREHVFCDTYILATAEKIYVVSGSVALESSGEKKKLEKIWRETAFSEYEVSEIDKLKCEEFLSGARLTAKKKDGE